MSEKLFADMLAELKSLNKQFALQKGVVGGSLFEALPFLEGWTYQTDINKGVLTLTRGGAPTNLVTWLPPENIGWAMGGQVIFSDPDSIMRIRIDNAEIAASPKMLSAETCLDLGFIKLECMIYDAAYIPPRYGIGAGSKLPLPFHNLVFFEAYHPSTAVTPTSYIWAYAFARIFVNNRKAWYESIQKLGRQETQGFLGAS